MLARVIGLAILGTYCCLLYALAKIELLLSYYRIPKMTAVHPWLLLRVVQSRVLRLRAVALVRLLLRWLCLMLWRPRVLWLSRWNYMLRLRVVRPLA